MCVESDLFEVYTTYLYFDRIILFLGAISNFFTEGDLYGLFSTELFKLALLALLIPSIVNSDLLSALLSSSFYFIYYY